jgi:hypothetical protein
MTRVSRETFDRLLAEQPPSLHDRTMTSLITRVAALEAERRSAQAVILHLLDLAGGEVTVPDLAFYGDSGRLLVTRTNANDGFILHAGGWEDAMHVPAPRYLRD